MNEGSEWMNKWMIVRANEWMNKQANGCMNEWMSEWMNEWMPGWLLLPFHIVLETADIQWHSPTSPEPGRYLVHS